MIKYYVVMREGIYQQGISSFHTCETKAREFATKAIADEPDDYHNFVCYKMGLDELLLDAEECIFECRRIGKSILITGGRRIK